MRIQDRPATHIPLLVRVFEKSEGNVLEIGTGYFSTLILNWLCSIHDRKLVSYESDPRWYKRAQNNSINSEVRLIESWDDLKADEYWGMIFVDHGPAERRIEEIKKFKDNCDYMVIHDTQPQANVYYRYSHIWSLFKYRYDYTKIIPWTSVVSNVKELDDIA